MADVLSATKATTVGNELPGERGRSVVYAGRAALLAGFALAGLFSAAVVSYPRLLATLALWSSSVALVTYPVFRRGRSRVTEAGSDVVTQLGYFETVDPGRLWRYRAGSVKRGRPKPVDQVVYGRGTRDDPSRLMYRAQESTGSEESLDLDFLVAQAMEAAAKQPEPAETAEATDSPTEEG